MNNNFIFNFCQKKPDDINIYPSPYKRSLCGMIDLMLVMFLRGVFLQAVHTFWFQEKILNFLNDFEQKFGTRTPKGTPEHIEFIQNHEFIYHSFILILITIMIGAVYYSYFNSSKWQATIGRRVFGIIVTDKNGNKVKFMDAFYHYLLSIIPYIYVFYVIIYSKKNDFDIYSTFINNKILALIGIFILFATHMNSFNAKKINLFDYLMDMEIISHRTKYKFPWGKK